jgi:hypothetical protein
MTKYRKTDHSAVTCVSSPELLAVLDRCSLATHLCASAALRAEWLRASRRPPVSSGRLGEAARDSRAVGLPNRSVRFIVVTLQALSYSGEPSGRGLVS